MQSAAESRETGVGEANDRLRREKRRLQQAVAVLAAVPAFAGLFGVLFGHALTGDINPSVSADSHFRFLSGLLMGIGLCFWSTVPSIEEKTTLFRFLSLMIVLGGLARLLGLYITGIPSLFMLLALFLELVVTPVLAVWQTRLANRWAEDTGVAP